MIASTQLEDLGDDEHIESPGQRTPRVRNDLPVFTANKISLFRMLSVLR